VIAPVPPTPSVPASLTFLGGAGTVTGSKTLVTDSGGRLLVDCGLFQGLGELRRRNWEPLPFEPDTIDAVALTHAHLDHCGYLPRLAAQGFAGPVYATAATTELAAIVLRDSAHLQEEDARNAAVGGYSKHTPPLPLYSSQDVDRMLHQLVAVDYSTRTPVAPGLDITLLPAGHILGSATVLVQPAEAGPVLFSGDLGRSHHPLLRPPAPPAAARTVVVESTYGDREHPHASDAALADLIRRTIERHGSVVIPAFAVDRTEVILMALKRLREQGEIPEVPVYVDSPMALAALAVYRKALDLRDATLRPGIGDDPFDPGSLIEVTSPDESRRLNQPSQPCIIVSASGMATGGRVVHHLAQMLPDQRNSVAHVGFQAEGTSGRDLLEGARSLKMLGHHVPVHAEVLGLGQYSIHADADEVLAWLGDLPEAPSIVYVGHGEPKGSSVLAERIRAELGWVAVVPRQGELVVLD
jgi:metallo-beta-lactamase family protein